MHPFVLEVYFHSVDVGNAFSCVHPLHFIENGVDVSVRCKIDAVFRNEIFRICGFQFACLAFPVSQIGEKQGYSHKGVASVMAFRINHSAVAFTADHSSCCLHHGGDVHLAHSGSGVVSSVLFGDVAQGACGAEVRHGVARCV